MPSAPLSPAMPSKPNVLPVSPTPGSATSFTPAVPGSHPNVDHNTPASRLTQTLQAPSATQPFSKILSDLGNTPSEPDVDDAPSECNPPLTDRAFRYQRRNASRTARIIHAGMFDPTDILSTSDPNDSIEFPAQNSVPSRSLLAYSPSRECTTQNVAATCPPLTHAPTAFDRPPFSAGARFSLRDFPPLVPPQAPCSMTPPPPLRPRTASAAGPSRSSASPPAFTAASADTSPVSLRAVSNSGETRHRGLRPDAPVPSRTLTPGPPGPPPHLAQLTAVWHTLSAATQAELGHVSSYQVAEGLELARFRDLAGADEEHRRALDPLLQRARLVADQKCAIDDEIAALHRAHAERVATITGDVHEPLSPDSPRTSAPPAPRRQHDPYTTTTATSVAHRELPPPTAAAAVTSAAAPVAAPTAAVPPAPHRSEHSAHVPPNTATSVATRTLSQRPAASVTFAAAPVAAPTATVTDAAAAMPPPATTTPWTVVAARPRRQPHTSSSSAAPTPDDSYLDLRVSRLMHENYRFPTHTRIPIKELATAVDRALTDPSRRKPCLRDAHRMATKENTPFCPRIVDDILRLVDLVRGCYGTPDGARWIRNTLQDAAARRPPPHPASSDSDSSAPGQRRREDPSSGRGNAKRATFPGTSDSDHSRRSEQDRRDRRQVHARAPTNYDAHPTFQQMSDAISAATMAAVDRHLAHLGLYPRPDSAAVQYSAAAPTHVQYTPAGLAPVASPPQRTSDVDLSTHSPATVQYSAAAPTHVQYTPAGLAPVASPPQRTSDVDPTTHSSATVQYSAAAPTHVQYTPAGLAPVAPPHRRMGTVDPTTHPSAPVQYSAAVPAPVQYSAPVPARVPYSTAPPPLQHPCEAPAPAVAPPVDAPPAAAPIDERILYDDSSSQISQPSSSSGPRPDFVANIQAAYRTLDMRRVPRVQPLQFPPSADRTAATQLLIRSMRDALSGIFDVTDPTGTVTMHSPVWVPGWHAPLLKLVKAAIIGNRDDTHDLHRLVESTARSCARDFAEVCRPHRDTLFFLSTSPSGSSC